MAIADVRKSASNLHSSHRIGFAMPIPVMYTARMSIATPDKRNNSAFDLTYHLVLMTKWRHPVLTPAMLDRFAEVAASTLASWRCVLIQSGGQTDHVHLLFHALLAMDLSRLVNNLKKVTSRLLRKEFHVDLTRFYWKPILWHGAYYVGSVGNASLDTVRR